MIKWDAPIEAIHANGMVQPVVLKTEDGFENPDSDGDYVIDGGLDCGIGYGPCVFRADGTPWIDDGEDWSAWTIRNSVGEI